MDKLQFSIIINASPDHVWDTMLSDATYRQWTAMFNPGSYYEGGWSEGSTIRFLGPDPANQNSLGGILGVVEQSRKPEFVSVRYTGLIKDGVEDTTSAEVQSWIGATESYTFNSIDGGTELIVDMAGVSQEFASFFDSTWPKALQVLKELSEA